MLFPPQYMWYKNGEIIISGNSYCIIAVQASGLYSCTVECDGNIDVSHPIQVIEIVHKSNSDCESIQEVKKAKVTFTDISLGEGVFGKVSVGKRAGLDVTIKHIKFQNRKSIRKMVRKEIKINGRIRHPNIVQLLATASESEGVYLVQEYIKGCNMDDPVFDDCNGQKIKCD